MSALSGLAGALDDVYGGNVEGEGVQTFLDTGFKPLNKAISGRYDGGLPCGRIVEMFGLESCGKTAIATAAMIAAQKAGGVALFMDHERSFMPHLGKQAGLCIDPKVGNFIHQKPKTFEESLDKVVEYLDIVRGKELIPKEAPIIVVFDSLAAMVPKSKFDKKAADTGMHDSLALAKASSSAFPVLQSYADDFNTCMLFLNQVRENF
jgi:RecA/RadA recombinase